MMMEKTRDTRTIGVAIIRLNGITIKSQCRSKFDNWGGGGGGSYSYIRIHISQTIKTIDFKIN